MRCNKSIKSFQRSADVDLSESTSDLTSTNYTDIQYPKVGINNPFWMGRPECHYSSWQVQSPHLVLGWNQIYAELCLSSHLARALFHEHCSGSGVGRSDSSSGHTQTLSHSNAFRGCHICYIRLSSKLFFTVASFSQLWLRLSSFTDPKVAALDNVL